MKIFVAGHKGLIGSAVMRALEAANTDIELITRDRSELNLECSSAVFEFFESVRPDYVVLAAGKVGGILDNKNNPFQFITKNLAIQLNTIQAAQQFGVKRFVLFGSSCMYPKHTEQPMNESSLHTGLPEPTSMAYAVSKMAGVELALSANKEFGNQVFIPLIPNSVYGPNDNFDIASGHVLSVLINRFTTAVNENASSVELWGSGAPRREFVYSDDVAAVVKAILLDTQAEIELPLNVGIGVDYSIKELAEVIAEEVGFKGEILWDTSKPDGAMRKLLDSSRLKSLGLSLETGLSEGIKKTYKWYVENV